MLRVVLAVALATAILAVSLPAIDTASIGRTDATIRAEVDGLETAVRDLQRNDGAVPRGTDGARRVVTVRLPARGWTSARPEYLAIGGRMDESRPDRNEATVAWRVEGGRTRTRRLAGVTVEHADGDDEPLILREPGSHRLALALVERGGNRTVVARRLSSLTP